MRELSRLLLLVALLLSGLFEVAQAHEVRPGYLELRQIDAETWDSLWKVPANGDRRLALYVQLPENCHNGEQGTRFINGAYIERCRTRCSGGLTGQEIGIAGLPATRTDVLARVTRIGASGLPGRYPGDVLGLRADLQLLSVKPAGVKQGESGNHETQNDQTGIRVFDVVLRRACVSPCAGRRLLSF